MDCAYHVRMCEDDRKGKNKKKYARDFRDSAST